MRPDTRMAEPLTPRPPARRPLLRARLTIIDPGDDPTPMASTIELIVTTEGPDASAREAEIPELGEAGWHSYDHGTLRVFSRVIPGA